MLLILSLSWMIIGQLPHKHSSRIVTPSVTPLHLPPSHFPWIFTTKDIYPPDFHHSTRYFSNCNNSASVYLTKTNCLNFKVWDHRSKQFICETIFSKASLHKSVRIQSSSGPYFPAFRLNANAGKYESEKLRIRKLFTHCI